MRVDIPRFSHRGKWLVEVRPRAAVDSLFQLTVEDEMNEMKTLPHRVYVTCTRVL